MKEIEALAEALEALEALDNEHDRLVSYYQRPVSVIDFLEAVGKFTGNKLSDIVRAVKDGISKLEELEGELESANDRIEELEQELEG